MLSLLLAMVLLASLSLAADEGIVGKKGQTLPIVNQPAAPAGPQMRADVEYSTTGALDTPAALGGSATGWGSHFIASWANLTGQDVFLAEFGWPCGGQGPVDWVVWLTAGSLPGAPGTQTFSGTFTPASSDDVTLPPAVYSYIDVSGAGIVVPPDMVMYFGYENPGLGGQISYNGVDTWAWYDNLWDPDSGWGRTAVLQFKGNFGGVATEPTSLSRIKAIFD
ncbi:MAG: hypothetical protein R3D98_03435 [Candidatus Krumholzibacteriia bacterium]